MEIGVGRKVLDARSNKELTIVAIPRDGVIARDENGVEFILTVGYTTYLSENGVREVIHV